MAVSKPQTNMYTMNHEIRDRYLDFFAKKQHLILPTSSPTVIKDLMRDPLTRLKNCTTEAREAGAHIYLSAENIEKVGDRYHTTLFEMLTHRTLGLESTREQISWIAEFLFKECGLDPQRLFVTVFRDDSSSRNTWQAKFKDAGIMTEGVSRSDHDGLHKSHIFLSDKGGIGSLNSKDKETASQIYYDLYPVCGTGHLNETSSQSVSGQRCHVDCGCGRFIRIGYFVFSENNATSQTLGVQGAEFSGWVERIALTLNEHHDVFLTSSFLQVILCLQKLSKKIYQRDERETRAFRIIVDHIRTAVFLLNASSGMMPSDKDQAMILQRLLGSVYTESQYLKVSGSALLAVSQMTINSFSHQYKDLLLNQGKIQSVLNKVWNRYEMNPLEIVAI